MSTMHRLIAPAVIAPALLAYEPTAVAETIGTACLDATGRIYNLSPFRSAPHPACQAGDKTVRFSLQQPDTQFAKRQRSGAGEMAEFGPDLIIELAVPADFEPATPGNCALVVENLNSDHLWLIADVPPGSYQDHLGPEVIQIDVLDDQIEARYQATKTVITDAGALVFHDVIVDYTESTCFASFLVEYARDPRQLYAR